MKGHGTKLTRKQEATIAALLVEQTHAAAAAVAGVSVASLNRWLRKPAFQRDYRRARRQLVEHAVGRVQAAMGKAVDTLVEVTENKDHKAADRVRAAVALLEHSVRGLTEADAVHGTPKAGDGSPMLPAEVVKVLSARLRQVGRSELATSEKSRLSATLADSLTRVRQVEELEKQIAELSERVGQLAEKKR